MHDDQCSPLFTFDLIVFFIEINNTVYMKFARFSVSMSIIIRFALNAISFLLFAHACIVFLQVSSSVNLYQTQVDAWFLLAVEQIYKRN